MKRPFQSPSKSFVVGAADAGDPAPDRLAQRDRGAAVREQQVVGDG
jgi:hypothetical protein